MDPGPNRYGVPQFARAGMSVANAATDVLKPATTPSFIGGTIGPHSSVARSAAQCSMIRITSAAGVTNRIIIRASAHGATTLSATPPDSDPIFTVVAPSTESF